MNIPGDDMSVPPCVNVVRKACMDFQSSFIRTTVDLVKHQKEREPEQKPTLSATSILTWISFPNMIGCVGLHYIFYILYIFSGIAVKS